MVRNAWRHPLLGLLNVLSIGLGIAVFLAIQIANQSANRSFAAGVDLVAGKAHLEIRGDVDETLWPKLRSETGILASTGVLEGVLTLPDYRGEYLQVLGVDLFTSEPFRTFELGSSGGAKAPGFSIEEWLGTPNGIALTEEFAARHAIRRGDRLRALVNSQERAVTVLAIFPTGDSPASAQPRFAVMDLGWAQELFSRQGRLSSLQLRLEDPREALRVAEKLKPMLPADISAEPPRQRSVQMESMLSAFQLNLSALSMVSLLVGSFLIYNSISASVVRRRSEIGIMRAMGATQWEVRALFLGEAALFGAVGIAVGTVAGVGLAQILLGAVAKTISSLYLLLSIDRSFVSPWQFAAAAVLGFAAVLVGAWAPANEAARIQPAAALSLGAHLEVGARRAERLPWESLACLVAVLVCSLLALTTGPSALAFGAAFFVLASVAFLTPLTTLRIGKVAASWPRSPVLWRLGADNLHRSVQRNAVTVAALTAAIAMAIGLVVMIHSFRQTVSAWIEQGIVADLFIAPSSNEIVGLSASVPPATIGWLEARGEVDSVDTFRERAVSVQTRSGPQQAALAVVKGGPRHNLRFVGGDSERKLREVFEKGAVAVTESFSRRHRVNTGDQLSITTPRGLVEFPVVGVYADYTRDQGVILMERSAYARHWEDPIVQSIAVYLRPGADASALSEAFQLAHNSAGEFLLYSNRTLRERIFAIFDQTFAVTYVLRTVAIIVAIAGIFLSVTTLVAERERELGILRAIGASGGQIQGMLMIEASLIGAIASALGMIAGGALAAVLTYVVNPAFFGWTIHLEIPWMSVLVTPLWIIPTAIAAAWYPAWRASRRPISAAVREE